MRVTIFDCIYSEGSGDESTTVKTTCLLLEPLGRVGGPELMIESKSWLSSVLPVFKKVFDGNPTVATEKYQLFARPGTQVNQSQLMALLQLVESESPPFRSIETLADGVFIRHEFRRFGGNCAKPGEFQGLVDFGVRFGKTWQGEKTVAKQSMPTPTAGAESVDVVDVQVVDQDVVVPEIVSPEIISVDSDENI